MAKIRIKPKVRDSTQNSHGTSSSSEIIMVNNFNYEIF